jgi:hypothetical protein
MNNNSIVSELEKDLNDALQRGWQEFPHDPNYPIIKKYSDHLRDTGFFESKFRKKIPHPGHDNAARVIGKYVIPVLIKYEVILDQIFPGDFSVSTGTDVGEYENRNFHMKAWRHQKPLCDITISFPHSHHEFKFPSKPFVTIGEIY